MPLHVAGVDKVASILEQFPIMRFVLWQYYLSVLMFVSLHGGEQTSVMSTACESMPETQPSGQDNHRSNKRPEELGMLCVIHGVELRADLVKEHLYTLHDKPSLFLILLTKEDITCGCGVPLLYKRKSLSLYVSSALGSSLERHDGHVRHQWPEVLRLVESVSPCSCQLLVAFFPALLSRHRNHPGGHHRRIIQVYDDITQSHCAYLPRVDQVVNVIRLVGVPD
jgi:hypothetical protein